MKSTLLPLAFLTAVAPALAQPADPRPNSEPGNQSASEQFSQLDRDGDGLLSREEFVAARPEKKRWWRDSEKGAGAATERDMARPHLFTTIDVNRDGFISQDELANAQPMENLRGRFNRDGEGGSEDLGDRREQPKPTLHDARPTPDKSVQSGSDDADRER